MKEDKDFDAVEMKRRAAERIIDHLKDLSPEEELEYWRRGHRELVAEQLRLKEGKQKKSA